MPVFGGVKGKEYTDNLEELEIMFNKHLSEIRKLDYDILEVKNTRWHDDYGQIFKEKVKELELMWQHIIALAFKNVSTVNDAVEMLENFHSLAKRPLVKEYVQKKAAEMVFKLFKDEIKEVEEIFESHTKQPPPMPFSHPKYGGLAIWVSSLIIRIEKSKEILDHLDNIISTEADNVTTNNIKEDAISKYAKLKEQLEQYIRKQLYQDWEKEIKNEINPDSVNEKLKQNVLTWSDQKNSELPPVLEESPLFKKQKKNGLLESNFDCDLHKVILEVQYWNKLLTYGVNLPHHLVALLQKKEQLRVLRENVMLIVRDYNNIKLTINDQEQLLFADHLHQLERQIEPGMRRYNWSNPADTFVFACRKECLEVFINVKQF